MGILAWLMGEEPDPITQIVNYENKGQFGEYLTNFALSKVKDYNQILNNVYIPIGNGKTTEIESIMVHKKGIFVFESKNYGGWIFGGIDQKNWTQCFPNREKYKFYNPIMQNRTHINALARVTGISKNKFFSFIIFSRRCELKKVPAKTSEFEIMKRGLLIRRLNEIATSNERPDIFSNEQIDNIANLIRPFTNVSNEVKQKHIEDIKNIKQT